MKHLGIVLSTEVSEAVDACEDSPVALMALSMAHNGLGNPTWFNRLPTFAEPSELFGRHWLLCYESNRQGWLAPPSGGDPLGAQPQFDFLRTQNVSFFNTNATPQIIPRHIAGAGGGGGGGGY
jgi:hypothetical protein